MAKKLPNSPGQHPAAQASRASAAEASSASVVNKLESFVRLTLHGMAESRGQSIRKLLQDITGLSKARIAKGKLDDVRLSTQKKIAAHQEKWLEDVFEGRREHLARAQALIAASPNLCNGKNAVLATWVHQFEVAPELVLPISKAVALTVDEVVDALLAACAQDDLERWKQTLLQHVRQHSVANSDSGQTVVFATNDAELGACEAIGTWAQAEALTIRLLDHWYLSTIAALDAEWGSHYFAGRQTMPLFPLVMGSMPPGWSDPERALSRKRLVIRPSRQLLQFLHALAHFVRYKKWPKNPPKPSELADALFRPDLTEEANRALIYNYFDGTAELTFDQVHSHWIQMAQHFMPNKNPQDLPDPPYPMIQLALQWQKLFVLEEGRALFVLDMAEYETLWRHYRQRWDEHQAKRDQANMRADHRRNEPVVWPAWMLNQSSSSS